LAVPLKLPVETPGVGTVAPWLVAVVVTVVVMVVGDTGVGGVPAGDPAGGGAVIVAVEVVVPGVDGGATVMLSPLKAVTVTVTVCPWAFVAV
jgi:hypothetical protein